MSATTSCPRCGRVNPASSLFCVGCGLPRSSVEHELREAAAAGDEDYQSLLENAQIGSAPLSEALRLMEARLESFDRVLGALESRLYTLETSSQPLKRTAPVTREVQLASLGQIATPTPHPPAPQPTIETPSEPRPKPVAPTTSVIRDEPIVPVAPVPPRPKEISIAPATPRRQPRDLEALIGGRGLAFFGGLAILIGAIFFLSMAFNRGWISPTLRVSLGVIIASILVVGGWQFFERRERLFGHVLVAVGLGIMSMSLFAAAELYDLIPVPLALVGALAASIAAALIAVRVDSPVVAAFGVVTGMTAPPLLAASVDVTTVAFLATLLAGTTLVSLNKNWGWLPLLAFLLTAPQIAAWIWDGAPVGPGMAALAGFWTLNTISAGGREFRLSAPNRLEPTSAGLMASNSIFLVVAGFELLSPTNEDLRGAFLLLVAAAHAAVGGYFLRREGEFNPFGMLAIGTGIAALTMAIPVQFGGPVVPMAWTSEAVALAWVADRRRHRFAGLAALTLGALAVGHLIVVEYPPSQIGSSDSTGSAAGLNGNLLAAVFVVGGLLASAVLTRNRDARVMLAGTAMLVLTYVLPFEVSGPALATSWCVLMMVAVIGQRRMGDEHVAPRDAATSPLAQLRYPGLDLIALLTGALAIVHLFTVEVSELSFDADTRPDPPFSDSAALVAGIIIAATAVSGLATRHRYLRRLALLTAIGVAGAIMPYQIGPAATVVVWSTLAVVPWILSWRQNTSEVWIGNVFESTLLIVAAWLVVLLEVAPASRILDALPRGDDPLIVSGTVAALAALIAAPATAAYFMRREPLSQIPLIAVFAAAAYLIRYQTGWVATVVGWSALVVLATVVDERAPNWEQATRGVVAALLIGATAITLIEVAPVERLIVDAQSSSDHAFLWSGATVALGSLAIALLAVYRRISAWKKSWLVLSLSASAVVYLLSVGVVDHFQAQVDGSIDMETLQRRAQVALSILWAVLGGIAFAFGIIRQRRAARILGLALLGLATAKVFLYDLAYLNTSYRVLSFIGLGVLLLLSSYLYQRVLVPMQTGDGESTPG